MGVCGIESPSFQNIENLGDSPFIHAESSNVIDAEPIQELLIDQLRDILHAEKQLLKALPKMAKSTRYFASHRPWPFLGGPRSQLQLRLSILNRLAP
jgi:Domain of unknown function (DUF892)